MASYYTGLDRAADARNCKALAQTRPKQAPTPLRRGRIHLFRNDGQALFLADREMILAWRGPATGETRSARHGEMRLRLRGASEHARPVGIDRLATRSHYFIGADRAGWRTNVPH